MHWDTFKQDNYSTAGGDGGVGLARHEPAHTATTSPMLDPKGFKLQKLSKVRSLHF